MVYARLGLALLSIAAFCVAAPAADTVLPLKVQSGGMGGGQDSRVFAATLTCNNEPGDFVWGCCGWTILNETFARKLGLTINAQDPDTAAYVDGEGRPFFLGSANVRFRLGGKLIEEDAKVIKAAFADPNTAGTIGYNVARAFQWQITPDAKSPTLTLREPRSNPSTRPVAVLPLKDDDDSLWVNVKVRGEAVDLVLMPQATDLQAGPTLQRKWDILAGKAADIKLLGKSVRSVMLVGKDAVELPNKLMETHVMVVLVGDPKDEESPGKRNGVGASLLNRYEYTVDAQFRELTLLRRMPAPATQPAVPKR